jgi:excisionase family DNA binding protein
VTETIKWIGTPEACARLGVTLRTLYRFIDEGQLPAYKMGRVIRLQAHEVDAFIEKTRILPGTLEHLYPDPRGAQVSRSTAAGGDDAGAGGTGSGRPVARGRGGADKGGADKGGPGDESRASVAGDELAASPGEGL